MRVLFAILLVGLAGCGPRYASRGEYLVEDTRTGKLYIVRVMGNPPFLQEVQQ